MRYFSKFSRITRVSGGFGHFVLGLGVVLAVAQGTGSKVESVTGQEGSGAKNLDKYIKEVLKKAKREPKEASQPSLEQESKQRKTNRTYAPQDSAEGRAGNIVGGIAITVNNDPITLYQIETQEREQHVSRQQAINALILQRIQAQEIKRLKIDIEDDKIDAEIENIARHNGMDTQDFMRTLAGEGINPSAYRAQLKKQLETRELLRNILLFNVNTNSETKMREYYNAHKEEFSIPSEIITIRYMAKDTKTLTQALENRNVEIPGVTHNEEKIHVKSLNPQIAQMFLSTKEHMFTPILNAGGGNYVSFFIKQKLGKEDVSFNQARNFIAGKLIEDQQDKILAEYYEKLRVKAKIRFLRQ
ncbi:SurA N-terminal domain-containing protein [Helicobacter bizzozeronii]|uniref:SurA N-terminal domain-containing protein n=1 Tax=Helicobacter bizzozeronii TaxID=56877 RepID=UPI001F44939A|nr:SurA N-terminal domain-containing protein [Helicobacter bizzozeronii]